eukprot:TRINITY_DN62948_c0_g1_i1.p1 TRINITY_DN62948_c0_g1~~TRINITY_DN62948_c0_g1_i1.p1  ORF type:complete len:737 (-),score=413.75 TRINITY_DN62948_c0_g1_i1:79-2289(-)
MMMLLNRVGVLRRSVSARGCVVSGVRRWLSSGRGEYDIANLRNIGISAHIDSGKTTLTERILYYTGRIGAIHEVRGKDGVGAKMDSMELERERGITIQSAATHTQWNDTHINIIDTPGHVDFTIEVERALRVLDGAVLVLCGVAGVQSQSITVDRQMRRYDVPRIAFVNKLDRDGADPLRVIEALESELNHNAIALQLPMGTGLKFEGVIDLLKQKALYFDGANGETVREEEIPEEYQELAQQKRTEIVERLADVDEEIGDLFLMEEEPTVEQILEALRRATISLQVTPVLMGSAYKNKGVQPMLDAVVKFLPNPTEVENHAIRQNEAGEEEKFTVSPDPDAPVIALAFKLEEGRYGQLTYVRVYQGTLRKGDMLYNTKTGKKIKASRLLRMHSNETQDIEEAPAGEIVALFGVDCSSGTTFTSGEMHTMTSMHVPEPVMSLAISPKDKNSSGFGKGLAKFVKEDPTFRVEYDDETQETLISGVGELHLDIYCQRLEREYNCEVTVGRPKVKHRETIGKRVEFDHRHKKQTGGQGQYGRVIGYIEPLEPNSKEVTVFENHMVGNNIPPEYLPAIQKGFNDAVQIGALAGHPVQDVKFVLTDGDSHPVDSSELAFRTATRNAFMNAFKQADPQLMEPIMTVEVDIPQEFQGAVIGGLTRRRAMIQETRSVGDGFVTVQCQVPLAEMFGYATDLRSLTEGKGEFSMEYSEHKRVLPQDQERIVKEYQAKREQELANKK